MIRGYRRPRSLRLAHSETVRFAPSQSVALPQPRFHPFNVYTEKKRREKLNPVRRGLVSSPGDWPWSSWRYYCLNHLSALRMDPLD